MKGFSEGSIAMCDKGCLGLVTKTRSKKVMGIHIDPNNPFQRAVGTPWESKCPKPVLHVLDYIEVRF